jgi:hypothetical protein
MNSHPFSSFVGVYLFLTFFSIFFLRLLHLFKFITVVLLCHILQKAAVHRSRNVDTSWETLTSVEGHWHRLWDSDTSLKALTPVERDWHLRASDTSWETVAPVERHWYQLREIDNWETDTSWGTLTPVEGHWHRLRDTDTGCETLTPV